MGTTTHAARRDGNVIIHVANGITHIGPARQQDGDYSYLADILQTVLPDVAWHNNIRAELWRKLAVNCVINPLTAIWNCPNGELRHHPQEIMQICEEVAAVVEREGHHTSAEDLRDYVMQVIDATAENISSMLQDIRALRHTEIDYINGFLRRARAHGIAVPENTRLFEMVKERRVNMSASALVCLAPVVKRPKPSPLSICWFAAVSKSPLPASPAMVTGDYLLARREAAGGCAAG